jgi:hypothetical protein
MDQILVALLTGIFVMLVVLGVEFRNLTQELAAVSHEVRNLRLASRTRVRPAAVQSGPVTNEQVMARLGRSTMSRRIVVGGDAESPLNTNLGVSLGGEAPHE